MTVTSALSPLIPADTAAVTASSHHDCCRLVLRAMQAATEPCDLLVARSCCTALQVLSRGVLLFTSTVLLLAPPLTMSHALPSRTPMAHQRVIQQRFTYRGFEHQRWTHSVTWYHRRIHATGLGTRDGILSRGARCVFRLQPRPSSVRPRRPLSDRIRRLTAFHTLATCPSRTALTRLLRAGRPRRAAAVFTMPQDAGRPAAGSPPTPRLRCSCHHGGVRCSVQHFSWYVKATALLPWSSGAPLMATRVTPSCACATTTRFALSLHPGTALFDMASGAKQLLALHLFACIANPDGIVSAPCYTMTD